MLPRIRPGGDMRARQRLFGLLGGLWLLNAACAGEDVSSLAALAALAAGGPCGEVYLEGVADGFRLDADLATPGASPEIVFEMFIPGSPGDVILLTREIVITLPAPFGFNGFDALGANAEIGGWEFDFSQPGNGVFDASDYRIPHRPMGATQAWADTRSNDVYDAGVDSIASHATGAGGTHVFSVVLPSGGTNNNGLGGNCSYFDTDTRFTLPAGIVVLPAAAGSYDVTVTATSVDPDTGDDDDGQGTPPSVYQRTVAITVPEPGAPAVTAGALVTLFALRRRMTG
jgi:hypothetical protein